MSSKRSARYRRVRYKLLPSKWLLPPIVLIVLVSLYFLYPKDFFSKHFSKGVEVSRTSLIYLNQLNRQYKDNKYLKLHQIRHQIELGHVVKASYELEKYSKNKLSSIEKEEVVWLGYILAREQFYQAKKIHRAYAKKKANMLVHLKALLPYTNTELEYKLLAEDSLGLGAPEFNTLIYQKLFKAYPNQPMNVYIRAAQAARYSRAYTQSSRYYFQLQAMEKGEVKKENYFMQAVAVLEESGNAKVALQAAVKNFKGLTVNRKLALFMAKISLRANDPKVAQHYLVQVLYKQEPKS